jgi:hypothetical protein
MARDIFSKLKKYAGSEISQDENYATEALAAMLLEFPWYKQYLVKTLFNIDISPDAQVKTQEGFSTNKLGRAILDLVLEDNETYLIVEAKISAGINQYKSQDELDGEIYDQVQKYEDCIGLPENKRVTIFILSQHSPKVKGSSYRYYNPGQNDVRWSDLYRITREYHAQLKDLTPEKYLFDHFIKFLKEENVAGFQGFTLQTLADMSRLAEVASILSSHRDLIKARIKIEGLRAKEENLIYGRDGVFYKWSGNEKVGIFVGLWYSDEIYHFKFPSVSGPQAMVFLEIPPNNPIRKRVLESEAYRKAGNSFGQKNVGYQVLLKSRPLTEFLGAEDQVGTLLSFYQESIEQLRQSEILNQIILLKP